MNLASFLIGLVKVAVEQTVERTTGQALCGILSEAVTAHGNLCVTQRAPRQACPRRTALGLITVPTEETAAAVTGWGVGQCVGNQVVRGTGRGHQAGQRATKATIDGHRGAIAEAGAGCAHLGTDWENTAECRTVRRGAHVEGLEDGAVMRGGVTHLGCNDLAEHGQGIRPRTGHVLCLVVGEDLRGVHEDQRAGRIEILDGGQNAADIQEHRSACAACHGGNNQHNRRGGTSIGALLRLLVIELVELLDSFLGKHLRHRRVQCVADVPQVAQGQDTADGAVLAGAVGKLRVIRLRRTRSPRGDLAQLAGAAQRFRDTRVELVVTLA